MIQEAIIVLKDIFRKYPNKYESIIGKLCERLDTLDEPEAKVRARSEWKQRRGCGNDTDQTSTQDTHSTYASHSDLHFHAFIQPRAPLIPSQAAMVWIIGEYADRISNADELLGEWVESFQDEDTQVQLQLLTATVKLFLQKPTGAYMPIQ